jgi:hypothetical protein
MRLRCLLATSVRGLSATAHAQSTGSVDFEESVIVVSGSALRNGVVRSPRSGRIIESTAGKP